jgi:hypothetical protein
MHNKVLWYRTNASHGTTENHRSNFQCAFVLHGSNQVEETHKWMLSHKHYFLDFA